RYGGLFVFYVVLSRIEWLCFHAMAQAPGGLLTHSYDHSMKAIYLNGILVGEIGMEAAIAGYYHIPLILVTGDSEGVKEAKSLLGEIETATVKYAINEHSALCLPLTVTHKEIKEKAKRATKNINQFAPFRLDPPYAIEVEFFQKEGTQRMEGLPGLQKINEVKVRVEGENLPLLWESFIGFYQQYD
ncbi:MAG TPA: M55 family metallopeptidase, partial [Candidatus Atribacteria bacterium]|nr:M55 family metallopeptidase [Candidatus Atribacteria bacterium]